MITKSSPDVPLGILELKEKWDMGERVQSAGAGGGGAGAGAGAGGAETDARGVPNSGGGEKRPGKIAGMLIEVRSSRFWGWFHVLLY